jgi:ketosteroid isomerase-like protein
MTDTATIVDAFADMITIGKADAIAPYLAPGAVVWHSHDRKDVDALENMASVAVLGQLVDGLSLEQRYCSPTNDGFVLQFVVHGTVRASGAPLEMQNCVVVTTADGLVTRIEEYVDPTVGAQLSAG